MLSAGSVIRDHGLIEIQPDAPAPSGDGLPTAAALDATSTSGNGNDASSSLLVNVNNRLVSHCLPLIPLAALHPSTGLPPFLPLNCLPCCTLCPSLFHQVPEETPLLDGDYVVLSRDRVRI